MKKDFLPPLHHLLQDQKTPQADPCPCPESLSSSHTAWKIQQSHDLILEILYRHLKESLPNGSTAAANLTGQLYILPTALPTDHKTDIVLHSSKHIHLFELTMCWKANFESLKQRKESKYLHLLEEARSNGMAATLFTMQVVCRGFIDRKIGRLFNNRKLHPLE